MKSMQKKKYFHFTLNIYIDLIWYYSIIDLALLFRVINYKMKN